MCLFLSGNTWFGRIESRCPQPPSNHPSSSAGLTHLSPSDTRRFQKRLPRGDSRNLEPRSRLLVGAAAT